MGELEIHFFLENFKEKMKIFDILFRDDRDKNIQTLVDLELRPVDRRSILESLEVRDYSQGPLPETMYGGAEMWVFGRLIKNHEVYIKISMGAIGTSVICISFHLAEQKINYPLK